jgi:thiosulfate/3-mercaptopyruvate sulfurtransferase
MQPPIGPLVTGAWLAAELGAAGLVVLDATVHLDPSEAPDRPYEPRSGRAGWTREQIPGSRFADVLGDLSDPDAPYPFTLPAAARFAAAMGRLGVGDDTTVVTYDRDTGMWAARLWWMLRVFGHDRVAVLDGGLPAWKAGGRPVSAGGEATIEDATFTPRFRPELVAAKDDVLAALGDPDTLLVNALAPEAHRGEQSRYGRAGRIPGSANVYARSLLGASGTFMPEDALREAFAESGALTTPHVIAYCGGGISAANDALALAALGRDDVAIYDGSMREWANDPELPLETG